MPQTITPINAGCHKFQTSTFNVFVIPVQTKIKFKINATGIINTPNVVEKLNGPAVPLPKSIILNVKP